MRPILGDVKPCFTAGGPGTWDTGQMITRRNLLKGAAAGVVASAAAATLIRLSSERAKFRQVYDRPMVQTEGFGLAPIKREGGFYYVDPADDPANRSWYGQHAPHLLDRSAPLMYHSPRRWNSPA